LAGALERVLVRALLAPAFRDELALLNRVATSDSSSAERHEYARGKYEVA
jgi:hypothetical protein